MRRICFISSYAALGFSSFTATAFAPHYHLPDVSFSRSHAVPTSHFHATPAIAQDEAQLDLLNNLEHDLEVLATLRPSLPSADPSIEQALVSAGSSYTRIWTHQTWKVHSDPPHKRYFRHIILWHKSTTSRKVLPVVLLATCWSIFVSLLAKYLQLRPVQSAIAMAGTSSVVSLLSAPLALLLTLRANASMARLIEARQAWGRLVLHTRGLASIMGTYIYPVNPQAAVLAIRYLAVLGWSLKAQVRGESETYQQDYLQTMFGQTTNGSECAWLSKQSKESVAITTRLRKICAVALSTHPTTAMDIMNTSTQLIVEERIRELEGVVGVCERLFASPIPPTYTRHLSRVMSMWLLLLPVSLIAMAQLKTVGVAFATSIATYVFVGLDEVGMEIEDVFRLLPLQQLAATAQRDVHENFIMAVRSPSVLP